MEFSFLVGDMRKTGLRKKKPNKLKEGIRESLTFNIKDCLIHYRGRLAHICGENSLKKCGFNEMHLPCFFENTERF